MTPLRILTHGGRIAPNDLRQVVGWALDYGLTTLEVGNRQEILLRPPTRTIREDLARRIHALGLPTDETDSQRPNLVSSLPATDLLADTPWLTAGTYLDCLAQFRDWTPRLKINLVDPVQTLVSPFTGNINFIASPEPGYWYVFLRPSGSVRRYAWPILIESESLEKFVRVVEHHYFQHSPDSGVRATADAFYRAVMADFQGNTRRVREPLTRDDTPTPIYEGFHRSPTGHYWLGLFRRQTVFPLPFIDALCDQCRSSRIGQLYLTPYKTILVKDIREADRPAWDRLLGRHGIRTNLPGWYLNWQLPNADEQSVLVRNEILQQLDNADIRTDELSFAINVPFSEAVASVIIHQNGSPQSFDVYQRTGHSATNAQYVLFAKSQPLAQLSDAIRQLSLAYYERLSTPTPVGFADDDRPAEQPQHCVHECPACLSRYDERYGEPGRGFAPGTPFTTLPDTYTCGLCDTEKAAFTPKWVAA